MSMVNISGIINKLLVLINYFVCYLIVLIKKFYCYHSSDSIIPWPIILINVGKPICEMVLKMVLPKQ